MRAGGRFDRADERLLVAEGLMREKNVRDEEFWSEKHV